ncbi:MAG: hypothetical protein AB1540_11235 [Bdellovibrionota bacterium]
MKFRSTGLVPLFLVLMVAAGFQPVSWAQESDAVEGCSDEQKKDLELKLEQKKKEWLASYNRASQTQALLKVSADQISWLKEKQAQFAGSGFPADAKSFLEGYVKEYKKRKAHAIEYQIQDAGLFLRNYDQETMEYYGRDVDNVQGANPLYRFFEEVLDGVEVYRVHWGWPDFDFAMGLGPYDGFRSPRLEIKEGRAVLVGGGYSDPVGFEQGIDLFSGELIPADPMQAVNAGIEQYRGAHEELVAQERNALFRKYPEECVIAVEIDEFLATKTASPAADLPTLEDGLIGKAAVNLGDVATGTVATSTVTTSTVAIVPTSTAAGEPAGTSTRTATVAGE